MPAAQPRIRFLAVPEMEDIQLVMGHGVTSGFPPHVHDALLVGVVDAGQRVISLDDRSYLAARRGLFVIGPGQRHACVAREAHNYRVLCLPSERLRALARQISGKDDRPQFPHPWISDQSLERDFRRLLGLLTRPASGLERDEALLAFLARLLAHADPAPGAPPAPGHHAKAVAGLARHIRECHAEPLRLDSLARLAGMSAFHFHKVFRRLTGLTPHEYQAKARIGRARKLIGLGEALPEVALAVGFSDQSHFNRVFKRLMGVTPGQYARGRKIG